MACILQFRTLHRIGGKLGEHSRYNHRLFDVYTLPVRESVHTVLNQSQVDSIFDHVPDRVTGESKRVLIVDDAAFMRMMLEDILTQHGHSVLQARDGMECLDTVQSEKVDICLLDIGMPGMDGLEVLKELKERQPLLRVVMISALSQADNVKRALQLGADAFVVKPFPAERLVEWLV